MFRRTFLSAAQVTAIVVPLDGNRFMGSSATTSTTKGSLFSLKEHEYVFFFSYFRRWLLLGN
jgi:hypothetical protein